MCSKLGALNFLYLKQFEKSVSCLQSIITNKMRPLFSRDTAAILIGEKTKREIEKYKGSTSSVHLSSVPSSLHTVSSLLLVIKVWREEGAQDLVYEGRGNKKREDRRVVLLRCFSPTRSERRSEQLWRAMMQEQTQIQRLGQLPHQLADWSPNSSGHLSAATPFCKHTSKQAGLAYALLKEPAAHRPTSVHI